MKKFIKVMKALSDPSRVKILKLLQQKKLCVCELQVLLGRWGGGIFAIQQGSLDFDLRRRCTEALAEADFDGFAIGGLAVGEPQAALYDAVSMAAPMLPARRHRRRHLGGQLGRLPRQPRVQGPSPR